MNLKAKIYYSLLIVLVSALVLSSCSDDNESTHGTLSVRMTDAPFPTDDVSEANVTVTKVEVRGKGESQGSPFVTLTEEPASYNLLDLTNGVTASLVDLEVPVGTYDLVRVYVSEASVVLKDGTTYDLSVPSGSSSGIKVFISPSIEVVGGLTSELLLDFDVANSFVPQGNAKDGYNGFTFKPTIKATNLSTAGRLVGSVTDSLSAVAEGAQVSVYAADTFNTSSFTDADGSYAILGLEAGSYDVVFEYLTYDSIVVEDVTINAANVTTQDVEFPVQ